MNQARLETLDSLAEFLQLDRQDSEAKEEIMGMRLPVYNAPAKKLIGLALPWHSSTILGRIFEAQKNSSWALATIPLTLRDSPLSRNHCLYRLESDTVQPRDSAAL